MMTTLYTGGRIFTAEPERPFVDALVVSDRVLFAGDLSGALAVAGDEAERIDLGDRMLMPGIHDAHTHLLSIGLRATHELRLTPFAEPAHALEELLAARPPASSEAGCCEWVVGNDLFTGHDRPDRLTRTQLDAAYPHNPVYLYDYSIHHGVANTKALELAGISEDDDFGHGGIYRRDEHGAMTGELIEEATWKVLRSIPDEEPEVYREAVAWAVKISHRYGITSVQEASASAQALRAFKALDDDGELALHVAAHLVWRNEQAGGAVGAVLDAMLDDHERWASPHVDTNFVKIYMDGAPMAPIPTQSAIGEDGAVDETWLLVSEDALFEKVREFDASGRTVKIHCAGDGATRVAVNAIERVRVANGPGKPHEIAHAGFVSAEDITRLSSLNTTAEMSPAVWHLPEFGLTENFPFSLMHAESARMTIGSDAILSPPNLFPPIQGAVQHPLHPVPLDVALDAVTRAGAQAIGKLHERGTLSAGKSADYIIIDRDLFSIDADEIGTTEVLRTFVEGRLVFTADR